MIKLLLAHGAMDSVNAATTDVGATPIGIAANNGHVDIVRILLRHGALSTIDTPIPDELISPLHAAGMGGHLLTAQVLVAFGAQLGVEDRDGDTPAAVSEKNGQPKVAEFLIVAATLSSPLEVAAGCGLDHDILRGLRDGLVDPDTLTIEQVRRCLATARQPPEPLWGWEPNPAIVDGRTIPMRNPKPNTNSTVRLMPGATRGWWPTTHRLYHTNVQDAVHALMLTANRLRNRGSVGEDGGGYGMRGGQSLNDAGKMLPVLPPEMFLQFASFFLRSDWKATARLFS